MASYIYANSGSSYFYPSSSTTSISTTSSSITFPSPTYTSSAGTGNVSICWDSISVPNRENTEDEKIAKIVEMDKQLCRMKEALDEALHMSKKLMLHQHNEKRIAAMREHFAPRVEAIQQEADILVEEAAEIMVFIR